MVKIEEGKFYRTADGEKVGPMRTSRNGDAYMKGDGYRRIWNSSGVRYLGNKEAQRNNIVSEWIDDPAPDKPTGQPSRSELHYAELSHILDAAFEQAAAGKGKERHANGQRFTDQPIMTIGRRRGIGFPLGQVEKKTDEAHGMFSRGEHDKAEAELLGAINYLAAAILLIREHKAGK